MYKEEKRQKLLGHLGDGLGIVSYACSKVGITRRTFYRWLEQYSDFKEEVERIQKERSSSVEDKLLKAIANNNLQAIVFYLKNRHPDYRPQVRIQSQREFNPYDNLTDKELENRVNKYLGKGDHATITSNK